MWAFCLPLCALKWQVNTDMFFSRIWHGAGCGSVPYSTVELHCWLPKSPQKLSGSCCSCTGWMRSVCCSMTGGTLLLRKIWPYNFPLVVTIYQQPCPLKGTEYFANEPFLFLFIIQWVKEFIFSSNLPGSQVKSALLLTELHFTQWTQHIFLKRKQRGLVKFGSPAFWQAVALCLSFWCL